MYLKPTLATLLLAGLYCPLAPAKYNDISVAAIQPAMTRVQFAKSIMVSDYTTPAAENEAEEQDQVGGADLTHAVWYHSTDAPLLFSDVAYHRHYKHRRSRKKSAAIIGGTAATGAVVGGLVGGGKGAVAGGLIGGGAGYVYDHNTKKK
jgi:hypothetical protein